MKMLESKGPKIDPCGISVIMTIPRAKRTILVLCFRLFRRSKRVFKLILS